MLEELRIKCKNCGCPYGEHHAGTQPWPYNYCPGNEGRLDWENGPGTTFERSVSEREVAIADSIALWKELSETGSWNKRVSIEKLFSEGMVSKEKYIMDCPLCDLYGDDCMRCPWPFSTEAVFEIKCRCADIVSPYSLWERLSVIKDATTLKKYAQNVLNLIKTFR